MRRVTAPPAGAPSDKECKKRLAELVDEIDHLQRVFYAEDRYALLLIFQAMDAAGKDSTIRAVLSGVNPAGCQVFCVALFKSSRLDEPDELLNNVLQQSTDSRRIISRGQGGDSAP